MKKKVLFVINTLGRAGAEMALLELLRQFPEDGFSVDLFVLMGQGELVDRLPEHVRLLNPVFSRESVFSAKGRGVMRRRVFRALFSHGAGIKLLPYLWAGMLQMLKKKRIQADKLLWRVLSDGAERFDGEYDLAVAFIEGGAAYYVADHVNARKKAAYIHIDYQMSGYTRKLDRDCYLKFDRVFPISEETMKCFLKVYPECGEKTRVFHNIVDTEEIRRKALLPGGFEDDFRGLRLLTVARLNKQKAFPVAIEAMKQIRDAGVNARWYVLGEGEERKNLQEQIDRLGLKEDFLLLGTRDNPYPYFRQTDIYVHATAFEGKSIAIQEAQTLGCCIVASDIVSNRQQITDGRDGVLCQLTPEAVRAAVLKLIDDAGLRRELGECAARKNVAHRQEMQYLWELFSE